MRNYLEAGKIINKRGLSGELKIESYCNSLDVFCSYKRFFLDDNGNDERKVIFAKPYKNNVYLKLEGCNSVEDADKLKNKYLYIHRDDADLSEDEVFIDDLIGLGVFDVDTGVKYGVLREVLNKGATDLYSVRNGKKEYLIPAVDEIVISIDTQKGIFIRPIPGLIDEAEEIK